MRLSSNFGGEGESRTHIAGFSDRCRDHLGYRPAPLREITAIFYQFTNVMASICSNLGSQFKV